MADEFAPLVDKIGATVDKFQKIVQPAQVAMFRKIVEELAALDVTSGQIDISAKNVRLIGSIKSKLMSTILTPEYKDAVREFVKAFDEVAALQTTYFRTLEKQYKPPKLAAEIQKQSVTAVVENLTERGIDANVVAGVENILKTSITTGGSIADLQEQLRNHITTNSAGIGTLDRYTKQITTDALNQNAAQYSQIVSSDLGLNWFRYQGSLIETSREFCVACRDKEWIHRSEFPAIIRGDFPEFDAAGGKLYKGQPEGMIPDTTPENFPVLRGGYNCGHQLRPVRDDAVPADVRARIQGAIVEPEPTKATTATAPTAPAPPPIPTPPTQAPTPKAAKTQSTERKPRQIPETPDGFTPAKNNKDASAWILDKRGLTYSKPTGKAKVLSVEARNLINKRVDELLELYDAPDLKKLDTFTDTQTNTANAHAHEGLIGFNSERYNDLEKFMKQKDRSVATGWNPNGANNRQSTIDHEFAHVLTAASLRSHFYWEQKKTPAMKEFNAEIIRLRAGYTAELKAGEAAGIEWTKHPEFISNYANKNIDEFVAESFLSSIHSAKPSKYAVAVRNLIDEYFMKVKPKPAPRLKIEEPKK